MERQKTIVSRHNETLQNNLKMEDKQITKASSAEEIVEECQKEVEELKCILEEQFRKGE